MITFIGETEVLKLKLVKMWMKVLIGKNRYWWKRYEKILNGKASRVYKKKNLRRNDQKQ